MGEHADIVNHCRDGRAASERAIKSAEASLQGERQELGLILIKAWFLRLLCHYSSELTNKLFAGVYEHSL